MTSTARSCRPSSWRIPVAGVVTVPLLAVAGCANQPVTVPGPTPSASAHALEDADLPGTPTVLLGFGSRSSSITQEGTARVRIGVDSLDDGKVEIAPGRAGEKALRFPPFTSDDAHYPRAVLTVSNATAADAMNPGDRDFVWGADFKIDDVSVGTGVDNGDNLVQRGTSGQPTLFKAEVDKDRPACSVLGSEGEVVARAKAHIQPETWYRMRCEKSNGLLTVYVTEFGPTSIVRSYASQSVGAIGTVRFKVPSIPLTIGGKVGLDGNIMARSSDQFNGEVMNPVLAFGSLRG